MCTFDEESTLLFQHILEPKKDSTCIRELSIGNYNTFHEISTGSVTVNILAPKQVDDNESETGTITSLDLLDLRDLCNNDFALVCDALSANPTGIQTRRLCLGRIGTADCDTMLRCLPKLLYVKQLSIEDVDYGASHENLLHALRQNGS
jgi:hypothetical protein